MNTNLILGVFLIAIILGPATLIFIIVFGFYNQKYEPKDQEDIELENAYINSLQVKDAEIVKAKSDQNE
jgi:hypothetical protein